MAKLARFYGFSPAEIGAMDLETADAFWRAVTVIEAQEALMQLKIVSYPHAEKSGRDDFYRDLSRLAQPASLSPEGNKTLTTEEIGQKLRSILGK